VSGLGGLLGWILIMVTIMAMLSFVVSLLVRKFLRGLPLVLVTVSLATGLMLTGVAAGMAKSDFTFGVVLPFLMCAAAIASVWLLWMKQGAAKD
jgi:hypothetical protein